MGWGGGPWPPWEKYLQGMYLIKAIQVTLLKKDTCSHIDFFMLSKKGFIQQNLNLIYFRLLSSSIENMFHLLLPSLNA